ncbi:MAG: threonylcarbamoyl-AMP synthase [Cryomorphaceae bacterium]|nr:threonylcarbamoyl-AMP synthase [Cryomorphaceae bacterium]
MRTGTNTDVAAELLRAGRLVAIPTETVYGLAAKGTDARAVAEIFSAKKRPFFDPLILHFYDQHRIEDYVHSVPEYFYNLYRAFSPGPVTYVLPRTDRVPDLVSSGLPTVGIRFPRHPLTRHLLFSLDFPLAAPSANRFGYISPTLAQHVDKQFGDELAYILDGGPCTLGIESTILDCTGPKVKVLRKGSLSVDRLIAELGYEPEIAQISSSRPSAPGNIDHHYAPHTPMYIGNLSENTRHFPSGTGVLSFGNNARNLKFQREINLSLKGDLTEAAANFFAALHLLDEDPEVKQILCEWFEEEGLGLALNDKIRRGGRISGTSN